MDFNYIEYGKKSYKRDPKVNIKKPQNLDLIIDYSKKLSKEFVFVRKDYYEINGTLYLGELTFSPSNVEMPYKDYNQRVYLGNLLNISDIKPSLFNSLIKIFNYLTCLYLIFLFC